MVTEPTLTSNRPAHLPASTTEKSGVSNLTLTPSRLPISLAVSMSKPSNVPSGLSSDCGG